MTSRKEGELAFWLHVHTITDTTFTTEPSQAQLCHDLGNGIAGEVAGEAARM